MENKTLIALVDDHVLLRNGLAALVNSFADFTVLFEADNGIDFIEKVNQTQMPEIVLLDVTMPGMNGYETAEWIKKNHPETKVLVLSMQDTDASIIRMLKNGARGYILKDSKPAVLKEALLQIRANGFYINDLVSSRLLHFVNNNNKDAADSIHLTEREKVFLKWVCSEKTYREIGSEMNVSARTIDSYRDSLFEKLDIKSRVGLVIFAIRNGIFIP